MQTPLLAASDEEMMEKIKQLEIQIQQLKALKEQQKAASGKERQCLKPFDGEKFCRCIANELPASVTFEQYLKTILAGKDGVDYHSLPDDAKKDADASFAAREKCAEKKGWFK